MPPAIPVLGGFSPIFTMTGLSGWQNNGLQRFHVLTPATCEYVFIESLSCVQLSATPWTSAHQAPLSSTVSWSLLRFMFIESVMLSNHLILCCLLLLSLVFPSIRVFFQGVSSSHKVARVLEFQLQYQSFQWIFRLISFRIDCFDLLAVQRTLKSFLQHHNLKTSILYGPALTSVHDYWKNHRFDYMDLCWQSDVSAF